MSNSLTLFICNAEPNPGETTLPGAAGGSQPIHYISPRPGVALSGNSGIRGTYLFRMLDRANPANPPLFDGTSDSPNEVPQGMLPFVDERHIVIVSMRADITKVPQGPLYDFLSQRCGAGSVLSKIEMLNSGFACGVVGLQFSYFLVAVPGQAVPSVEHMGFSKTTNRNPTVTLQVGYPSDRDANWRNTYHNNNLYANADRGIHSYLADNELPNYSPAVQGVANIGGRGQSELLVVQLIPGSDGLYTPVPVP